MPTQIYRKELRFWNETEYRFMSWRDFDFDLIKHIQTKKKTTGKKSYMDAVIMADTETSRKRDGTKRNHVCAWSIAFRAFGRNLFGLWGQNPAEFAEMLERIREKSEADEIYIYFHHLAYDWVFLRKFLFDHFGYPEEQLNTKPLYPLYIRFENGIVLKDSLILAQRGLEKWANDLQVDHQKAVGAWDYERYRTQKEHFTPDELLYIENDVLAGIECIDTTMRQIGKHIGSIPYTATGIVRGECRDISKQNRGQEWFQSIQNPEYAIQKMLETLFHGGYTHNNRYYQGLVNPAKCFDFSSSYPFEMLCRLFPGEKFWKFSSGFVDPMTILENAEEYAFIFRVSCYDVKLADPRDPMPTLQYCRKIETENAILDNGRVLACEYLSCLMNEIDFRIFVNKYDAKGLIIEDVYCAKKEPLPRWLRDYVFERYRLKCELKHMDPVQLAIEKAKLNSIFGMTAQRPCKEELIEDYATGLYRIESGYDAEAKYEKWYKSRSSFLPYSIGVWVTSYAMEDLFTLGGCASGIWLYSDTDSVYATEFDERRLKAFNESRKKMLIDAGYGSVTVNGEIFTVGEATPDGTYTQFKALHSKCYCSRPLVAEGEGFTMAGDLKLTVAGVPKKGAKSLKNNIDNFKIGFVFSGEISGKLQHEHHFIEEIYTDEDGNLTGDSIDLSPCDYMIKPQDDFTLEDLTGEEVSIQTYDETVF